MNDGYLEEYVFPQFVGAVEGTNIKIAEPSERFSDSISRKGCFSLSAQTPCVITSTVCNSKSSNAVVKWPVSIHEAQIFLNSSINRMLTKRIIPPCEKIFVEGRNPVLVFLLGDPVYPLLQFLMK